MKLPFIVITATILAGVAAARASTHATAAPTSLTTKRIRTGVTSVEFGLLKDVELRSPLSICSAGGVTTLPRWRCFGGTATLSKLFEPSKTDTGTWVELTVTSDSLESLTDVVAGSPRIFVFNNQPEDHDDHD